MKELTIEQKAKAYDEALERAKEWFNPEEPDSYTCIVESIFPELKESEDEQSKNWILEYLHDGLRESDEQFKDQFKCAIAWLEKQGQQRTADKVEPKFHKGDWTVSNLDGKTRQISEVHFDEYNSYYMINGKSVNLEEYDRLHRLWTIQDAKSGDILAFDNNTIVILKDLYNVTTFHSYCHIENNVFDISKDDMPDWWEGEGFHPATKEQRDLLFQKMKEDGYEWDAEKKELKKIELKLVDNIESYTFKDKLLELFQKFRYIKKDILTNGDIIDYVNAHIQELIDTIQKPAWSKKDVDIIDGIIIDYKEEIECLSNSTIDEQAKPIYQERIDFLNRLKTYCPVKQEWSEEDAEKLELKKL